MSDAPRSLTSNITSRLGIHTRYMICLGVGLVFICAGILKSYALWVDSANPDFGWPGPALQVGWTAFEIALGCLLVSGKWSNYSQPLALFAVALVTAVSFVYVVQQKPDCGCLGKTRLSPLVSLTVDVVMLCALVFTVPVNKQRSIGIPFWHRLQCRPSRAILWLSLAFAISIVGYFFGQTFLESTANAGLSIENAQLDFGDVWETDTFGWAISISNPTDEDVTIQSLQASCNCIRFASKQIVIPAQGSAAVHFLIDLTPRSLAGRNAVPVRSFSAGIRPVISGKKARQRGWKISGRIKSPLTLSDSNIDISNQPIIAGHSSPPRHIVATGSIAVSDVLVQNKNPDISATVERVAPDVNQFKVSVQARSTLRPGDYRERIELVPTAKEHGRMFPLVVWYTVRVLPDVIVSPSHLALFSPDTLPSHRTIISAKSLSGREASSADVIDKGGLLSIEEAGRGSDGSFRFSVAPKDKGTLSASTSLQVTLYFSNQQSARTDLRVLIGTGSLPPK